MRFHAGTSACDIGAAASALGSIVTRPVPLQQLAGRGARTRCGSTWISSSVASSIRVSARPAGRRYGRVVSISRRPYSRPNRPSRTRPTATTSAIEPTPTAVPVSSSRSTGHAAVADAAEVEAEPRGRPVPAVSRIAGERPLEPIGRQLRVAGRDVQPGDRGRGRPSSASCSFAIGGHSASGPRRRRIRRLPGGRRTGAAVVSKVLRVSGCERGTAACGSRCGRGLLEDLVGLGRRADGVLPSAGGRRGSSSSASRMMRRGSYRRGSSRCQSTSSKSGPELVAHALLRAVDHAAERPAPTGRASLRRRAACPGRRGTARAPMTRSFSNDRSNISGPGGVSAGTRRDGDGLRAASGSCADWSSPRMILTDWPRLLAKTGSLVAPKIMRITATRMRRWKPVSPASMAVPSRLPERVGRHRRGCSAVR